MGGGDRWEGVAGEYSQYLRIMRPVAVLQAEGIHPEQLRSCRFAVDTQFLGTPKEGEDPPKTARRAAY